VFHFFGTDFTDYTGFLLGGQAFFIVVIFLARISRISLFLVWKKYYTQEVCWIFGVEAIIFESIWIKGVYVSYWRLGIGFCFWWCKFCLNS